MTPVIIQPQDSNLMVLGSKQVKLQKSTTKACNGLQAFQ